MFLNPSKRGPGRLLEASSADRCSWSVAMNDVPPHHRPNHGPGRSRLVLGIFLLALGALMLAINLGYGLPVGWWQYFPVPLIALGLWGLILPSRHLDRSGGVWLLASGLYCLIGVFDLWDLGWGGAWPIFVIAAGLSFMLHRHDGPDARRSAKTPGNGGA
jgi:hypothetical protein